MVHESLDAIILKGEENAIIFKGEKSTFPLQIRRATTRKELKASERWADVVSLHGIHH